MEPTLSTAEGRMNRKLTAALALAAAFGGCDKVGTEPAGSPRVSLSLMSASAAAPAASRLRRDVVPLSDGSGSSLEVEGVQLLLRDVELKRQDDDACEEEDDSCEKFHAGVTLVDLPLDSRLVTPFSSPVPEGVYDRLEMRLQEPEDRTGDRAAFQADHPDWPRKATVRVTGSFDSGSGAEPFDIFLPVKLKIERDLDPPLVVDDSTDAATINLTVEVDVESWFRDRDGGLIDPAAAALDERLMKQVEENVRQSFRAVRDDDRDGHDDGHGHGSDDDGGDDHGNGGGDDHGGDDHGGHH
jgi:hypothetical protein